MGSSSSSSSSSSSKGPGDLKKTDVAVGKRLLFSQILPEDVETLRSFGLVDQKDFIKGQLKFSPDALGKWQEFGLIDKEGFITEDFKFPLQTIEKWKALGFADKEGKIKKIKLLQIKDLTVQNLSEWGILDMIVPSGWSPTHWAIKCGQYYYQLVRDKPNGDIIVIEPIKSLEQLNTFRWNKQGDMKRQDWEVLRLTTIITAKKWQYYLFRRNCQHAAAAIGNYAMNQMTQEQALKYLEDLNNK